MLTIDEIKLFIDEDATSEKKMFARKGQDYYEGNHDIRNYRLFYYNAEGELVEDKTRSNIKISHPFMTELVDQGTQFILSGSDGIFKSDMPELQAYLDTYFNNDEDFLAELSELLTGGQNKGFEYMFAHKNSENRITFQCADSLGVVEVRAKDTDTKAEHFIYHYIDRIDKGRKTIKRIQVWDDKVVEFFVQDGDGNIVHDDTEPINPRPHTLYKKDGDDATYYKEDEKGFIPFFRFDMNKKQFGLLKAIKALIDDYDLMACGLSNNIQDSAEYTVVVSGFQGDDLDELVRNIKTKKHIGTDTDGGVEFKTVDIPYEARKVKLELDEKNIYRFGMGLNTSGLKDTTATTNIAIKAAYSLLELRCSKIEIKLKQFLRKLVNVVLQEINEINGTDYQQKDVYFEFNHEIMSNELENAQVRQMEAQEQQLRINTLLSLATQLGNELMMQNICDVLEIDYEEIKSKLPNPNEADDELGNAQSALNGVPVEGDPVNEEV